MPHTRIQERGGESSELSPNCPELIPNPHGESFELSPNYPKLISNSRNSRGIRCNSRNIRATNARNIRATSAGLARLSFAKPKFGGFTLLELLVVIAILAVLAAVTAVVINPAELMSRSRDTERLTELNSIHRNLGKFLATAPSPTLGLANRVYISLPDTSPTCATWTGLPPLPAG
jgi:prepilin-type N-terminal cleavage/methylation domain-containing protein